MGKKKKSDAAPKNLGAGVIREVPGKFDLNPVEKEISDKYGNAGLRAYKLIDGQRTAADILRETGFTESKLVQMLDFMDEQGIIRLDYPKDSKMILVKEKYGEPGKKVLGALKGWKNLDALQKETSIDRRHLKRILDFLEENGLVLSNHAGEFASREYACLDPAMKTLYDKTSKQFGLDAVRLYLLVDGRASIRKIRNSIPKAVKIIRFLAKDGTIAMDPFRKTPVRANISFTGATLPLMYDKAANKTFRRAMRYYDMRLFSRAEEELTGLIHRKADAAYLVNRGSALYRQKKLAEAIADFTRAIELDRENLKAFYNRGISYFEKGDYETAMADITHAIQLKPDFASAYYMRGSAIECIGKNIPDAIADFEKALQLQPDFKEAVRHLEAVKAKRKLTRTTDNDLTDVGESVPKVRLSDVGGMTKLKGGAISGILFMLKEPEKVKEFGIAFGGGVLLYGPPGCGKSFVTEAIAGEANMNRRVAFIRASIAETLNKYIGNSEKNLHNIFEYARARQPAIIFFDEMEALGGAREDIQEHWGRAFVNQFLIEMDQIEKKKEQVLVIGATNSPWFVDYALRRSGRFTEKIFIGPPDEQERKEIFKVHTRQIAALLDVDYDKLAKATDGFSGADIQALCKDVARNALVELSRTNIPRKMKTGDFTQAIEEGRKEGKYSSIKEWLEISKRYGKTPPKESSGKEWTMFG